MDLSVEELRQRLEAAGAPVPAERLPALRAWATSLIGQMRELRAAPLGATEPAIVFPATWRTGARDGAR